MEHSTGKRAYEIYRTIMTEDQYRSLSGEFQKRLDELQKMSDTFMPEQWAAIEAYLDISSKVYQQMIEIALKAE